MKIVFNLLDPLSPKALGSLMGSWTTFGELGYPNYFAEFGGQGYILV